MAIFFDIIREGSNFSARPDKGSQFPIGQKVRYRNKKAGIELFGLSNDAPHFGSEYARKSLYKAESFHESFPVWADFIEPTAICEGGSFLSLNTYDRAQFTFGFGQFAAHVENGDFVRWFRDMLQRPEAVDYFPNLEVRNGRIVKVEDTRVVLLETDDSTKLLMDYLNPSLDGVEDAEVIAAAKFMHWTVNFPEAALLQVQHMINTARRLVRSADRRLSLDGVTGDICCIIFDILHQGRGGFDEIQEALLKQQAFEAVIEVGGVGYPNRVATLKSAMKRRRAGLQALKWSRRISDFVSVGVA